MGGKKEAAGKRKEGMSTQGMESQCEKKPPPSTASCTIAPQDVVKVIEVVHINICSIKIYSNII